MRNRHAFEASTQIAEEMLLGSVTKHVLAEAQGDVLVVADSRSSEGRLK